MVHLSVKTKSGAVVVLRASVRFSSSRFVAAIVLDDIPAVLAADLTGIETVSDYSNEYISGRYSVILATSRIVADVVTAE